MIRRLMLHRPRRSSAYLPLASLTLLAGLALRLIGTLRLPLFLDEAIHLSWAQRVRAGEFYIGFQNNKFLYPVFLSLFNPTGPEAPWLARALSALLGMLSAALVVALGRTLAGRQAGLLAGLIYALLPFAVFHERQALVDPFMVCFATAITLLCIWLARRPTIWQAILLALLLAGAYLTKIAALPYFALPLVGLALFARRDTIWKGLALSTLGIALAAILVALAYAGAARQGVLPSAIYRLDFDNTALSGAGSAGRFARLPRDLADYAQMMLRYGGAGLIALLVPIPVWLARRDTGRGWLYLMIPAFAFALVPLLAGRPAGFLAPRYLLATAAPLAALAGMSLAKLLDRVGLRWQLAGVLILLGVLGQSLWFDVSLIADPRLAPLTRIDRHQYVEGDASGYARQPVARDLLAAWQTHSGIPLRVLNAGGSQVWMKAYLGPRLLEIAMFRPDDGAQPTMLADWLAEGPVFVLEDTEAFIPPGTYGLQLTRLDDYRNGNRHLRLWQVSGVEGTLADAIYQRLAPAPAQMIADQTALAGWLSADATNRLVIVFPSSHAPALAARSPLDIQPLLLNRWPPDERSVGAALDPFAWGDDVAPVEIVLVDEACTDPDRIILLALQRRLYFVRQDWAGLYHRLAYVTGPPDPPFEPLEAVFEGGITLRGVALLDREASGGDALRLALRWQTPARIQESYNIFVHVVGPNENLIAQLDVIPGGGLLPMPSWEPGQPVTDRLAIWLPPDAPPGVYEIRVGIYHPGSGLRLPVIVAQSAGPGYIVVGHVEIRP